MNKAELIELMLKDKEAEFKSKAEAERAVNSVIEAVKKGLKTKDEVQLIGFGTFRVKTTKARNGVNPATKQPIKIKASKTVRFSCGKALKDFVR